MATAQVTAPLRRIETPFGAAAWRALDWDTEQFGIPAARLDLLETSGSYTDARAHNRELLRAVLAECREGGIRHAPQPHPHVEIDVLAGVDHVEAGAPEGYRQGQNQRRPLDLGPAFPPAKARACSPGWR